MRTAYKIVLCLFLFSFCGNGIAQTNSTDNFSDSLGRKQGKWIEYYPSGNLKSISYYRDNLIDSIYKEFYETGEKEFEIYFHNGLNDGTYTRYFKNGVINNLNFYNEGKPIWTAIYDEKGYLLMEEIFSEGQSVSIIHYDKGKYLTRGSSSPRLHYKR